MRGFLWAVWFRNSKKLKGSNRGGSLKVSVPIVILPFGRLIIIGCRPDWKVEISKLSIPRLWERSVPGGASKNREQSKGGNWMRSFCIRGTTPPLFWFTLARKIFENLRSDPAPSSSAPFLRLGRLRLLLPPLFSTQPPCWVDQNHSAITLERSLRANGKQSSSL